MKFMGSKSRIARYILPIMLKNRKSSQFWVEPFVGGGNMIDKVDGLRAGYDIDKDVISALNLIRTNTGILPKDNSYFNEQNYKDMRNNPKHPLYGYVAYALSYGGKKWGGWRRDSVGKRDYVREAYDNAIKQSPNLPGILIQSDYQDIPLNDLGKQCVVYCDPPYIGTTKYCHNFNSDLFWDWCRDIVKDGHTVFVSEYNAPEDFECIWTGDIVSSLTKNTGSKMGHEKLFTFRG